MNKQPFDIPYTVKRGLLGCCLAAAFGLVLYLIQRLLVTPLVVSWGAETGEDVFAASAFCWTLAFVAGMLTLLWWDVSGRNLADAIYKRWIA